MKTVTTTYRKDYTPPSFSIETVDLKVTLGEEITQVQTTLHILRQPNTLKQRH